MRKARVTPKVQSKAPAGKPQSSPLHGKNGNPFAKEAKVPPGPKIISEEALAEVLDKLEIHFHPDKGCFWGKNQRGNWIKLSAGDVERRLTKMGYNPRRPRGGTISETNQIIEAIQTQKDVEFVGPLAGYRKGLTKFAGKRLLIREEAKLIAPAPGNYPTLQAFLSGLLGEIQLPYFRGWMKVALEALYSGDLRPGQALVLTGKRDSGKSFLQKLITIMLGGRMARPYNFMSGKTAFNDNLFGSEHLSIEDEVPFTDIKSRRNFSAKIKEVTAIDDQNCHFKFQDGVTLPIFWRLTISVNDETENLMILPPMDDSLIDKMIIFKVDPYNFPVSEDKDGGRKKFLADIIAELPAFIYNVLEEETPKKLVSRRYGILHYQHPEIMNRLGELSPEICTLQLIDDVLFLPRVSEGLAKGEVRTPEEWVGSALELEKFLTDDCSPVKIQARKLFTWSNACGTYSGRVAKIYPNRFSYRKRGRVWTIKKPPEDDENPSPPS